MHDQCNSIIFPKPISFESSLPCWRQDSLLLTGSGIYPQIYHRTSSLAVLIFKREYFRFHKRGEFFISYDNQVILGVVSKIGSLLLSSKKVLFSFSLWLSREYTLTLNWKNGILLIRFENCQGSPYSHRHSRNRMMYTFQIVNITPRCKR